MGVLAVRHSDAAKLLLPEYRQILENYSTQVALAIERDRLTLESDKARLQAETERIRSTLLSSISHDLRTPLAVIVGASSSLLHGGASMDEPTRRELLETIFEESDRLSRLVENILRMTQLSSSEKPAINKEWQPVEEIVASALRRLERTLADRPVSVKLPPEFLLAQVDAVLVEQAIVNLLDNACRYTPAGTPIEIRAWQDGRKTVLEIADHGPGLKPGDEQRIFERFQRGDDAKSDSRGAGLGLAICRAIMDAHGGRISARNREGGGAVFRLEFVADGPPPRDVETMNATAEQQSGAALAALRLDATWSRNHDPAQFPKILIIEDEAEIRRFLRATLLGSGYRVLESPTGEDGLQKATDEKPALVLLDLGLPDMDGLSVIRKLREWSNVPIIVLSARGNEADKIKALDGGADDYLTKPFGVGELLARVRVALRRLPDVSPKQTPRCLSLAICASTSAGTRSSSAKRKCISRPSSIGF